MKSESILRVNLAVADDRIAELEEALRAIIYMNVDEMCEKGWPLAEKVLRGSTNTHNPSKDIKELKQEVSLLRRVRRSYKNEIKTLKEKSMTKECPQVEIQKLQETLEEKDRLIAILKARIWKMERDAKAAIRALS